MSSGQIPSLEAHPPSLAARLALPLARFAGLGVAGGCVLLLCTIVAIVWVNGGHGGREVYRELFHAPIGISVGNFVFEKPLEWWINDGLMAIFFFLIGLEIKREVLVVGGALRSPKAAALPCLAAVGGMLFPGLIYYVFNAGGPTVRGWGIPTATDIAFSLGILTLLGARVPSGLRVFLATLAVADDLGALLVIAFFYTERLEPVFLGYAGVCLAVMVALNMMGVRRWWLYFLPGVVMWFMLHQSGVHATIAGVAAAFTIPATTREKRPLQNRDLVAQASGLCEADTRAGQRLVAPSERACPVPSPLHVMENALTPWVTFAIVPLFALANAGVSIGGNLSTAFRAPETLGVMLGLMLGKPIGITLFSFLAVAVGIGKKPTGVTWGMLHGVSWIAGIGFTMSLFIAHLAFPVTGTPANIAAMTTALNNAKLGILAGSTLAATMGLVILWGARGRRE